MSPSSDREGGYKFSTTTANQHFEIQSAWIIPLIACSQEIITKLCILNLHVKGEIPLRGQHQ